MNFLLFFGFQEESRSAVATTMQAPARNAPWTIVGMIMAVRGATANASGRTMNVPTQTPKVKIIFLAIYMDIALSSQQPLVSRSSSAHFGSHVSIHASIARPERIWNLNKILINSGLHVALF